MAKTRQIVANNLRKLLTEKGMKAELSRYCNVSDAAVAHWTRKEEPKVPTPENLDDIARFFQIEVSDLFSERPLSREERRALYILARLNDEERATALGMLEVLLKNSAWSKESTSSTGTGG